MTALLIAAITIFSLRILDVSMGILRISMVVRGRRRLAGIFGFLESLIWLVAAAQVLKDLDSPIKYIAYAGGFAAGTMIGTTIERWIAVGHVMFRIVAPVNSPQVAEALRAEGFFVTVVNAEGRDGKVRISFSVVPRRKIPKVKTIVQQINPDAFVTFETTNPAKKLNIPAIRVRK